MPVKVCTQGGCPVRHRQRTLSSSQEPEVLLPPCADEVATDTLALPPHRQRQALRTVDALLHERLAAATHEAAFAFCNVILAHTQSQTNNIQQTNSRLRDYTSANLNNEHGTVCSHGEKATFPTQISLFVSP